MEAILHSMDLKVLISLAGGGGEESRSCRVALFIVLLLAGFFLFRGRGSQREASREPSSVEVVHQLDLAGSRSL